MEIFGYLFLDIFRVIPNTLEGLHLCVQVEMIFVMLELVFIRVNDPS